MQDHGYTFLEFPENVGGRFSAFTSVGLLPMAVAGLDIRSFVKGAAKMERQLKESDWKNNMAYQYACLGSLYKGKRLWDRDAGRFSTAVSLVLQMVDTVVCGNGGQGRKRIVSGFGRVLRRTACSGTVYSGGNAAAF